MTLQTTCPSCGATVLEPFYEARGVPVQSAMVLKSAEAALQVPVGDVVLVLCPECGFITNCAFAPPAIDLAAGYEDQQGFSGTFSAYADRLARRLIDKYDLHGKDVVEVGCGKGDFLALLCELGQNRGVGIDPLCDPERLPKAAGERITVVREELSEHHSRYACDFLCCRHTLEHVHDTGAFLNTLRRALGDRFDAVVFFEVPDVSRILREGAFWDVYYEHCSYFSLDSLARLFRRSGFEPLTVYREYHDQYLIIEARPSARTSGDSGAAGESMSVIQDDVDHFATKVKGGIDQWRNRIRGPGRRVIWGSGSKCVAFVTTLGIGDRIHRVVDVNPFRHGRFMPGVSAPIVGPEALREGAPEEIIVMNPVYRDEIAASVGGMGLSCRIVTI